MRLDDASTVAELTTQLGYAVEGPAQAVRIAGLLAAPGEHAALVAADAEDRPLGWIHVARQRYLEGDDTAVIMGLVVGEGHRSGGIGAELLGAGEAWAARIGCTTMTVRSRVTRERAHRFYERHGYLLEKTSHTFRKPLA